MRDLALKVVVALAICSSPAYAVDHLMHVSEVMVSQNNNTDIRFIELADPGLEPFPNTYKLVVYTATGTVHETVNLTVAANTQRMLIGTAQADTAFSTTRDATLAMALPVDGQACFESATTKIHCLAWGCVTNLVVAGASRGATPPTGQSLQRQGDATYQVATPTPDASNQAGAPSPACPTQLDSPNVDGPPMGADAGTGGNADAGTGGNNNTGSDDGCCQVDGQRGATGAALIAFVVGLVLRRGRRKPSAK